MSQLDHIGIYVRSIEASSKIYERLGFKVERTIQFQAGGRSVPIAFIPVAPGVDLELIEAPGALDAGLEPLHHIYFEVADIAAELEGCKAAGGPHPSPAGGDAAARRHLRHFSRLVSTGTRHSPKLTRNDAGPSAGARNPRGLGYLSRRPGRPKKDSSRCAR